jgi:hypothetical protein
MGCDSMKPGIAQIKATVASACCHHSIFVWRRREENVTFTFNNLSQETTQKLLPQSLSFRTFCSCHHVVGIRLDLCRLLNKRVSPYNCNLSVVYQYWSNINL